MVDGDYEYAVITENEIFTCSWKQRDREVKQIKSYSPARKNYEALIHRVISFIYENNPVNWEETLEKDDPQLCLYKLNDQLKLKYLSD